MLPSSTIEKVHQSVNNILQDTPYILAIFDECNHCVTLHNIVNQEIIPDALRGLGDRFEEGDYFDIPNDN